MNKHTFFISEKSDKKNYIIADGISAFLLVNFSFHCLISSFNLNVNSAVLFICTALFAGVFAIISALVKSNAKYAGCIGVIFAVFVLVVLFSYNTLASQLNYVINSMLKEYSIYLVVPQSVSFAAGTNNATALFVVVSALMCGLLTSFLIRLKLIFPAAALSIIVIIPCFILINTLPDIFPLLGLFAVLFTLFVSSAIHRINTTHTSAVTPIVAVFMAILVAVVYIFNPIEGYKRNPWQDNILEFTQDLFNMESHDSALTSVSARTKHIQQKVDLSKSGPLEKTNQKIMTINTEAPYLGRIYLRGVAYTNYENNTWSLMTDEQARSYPENYESFTMTITQDVPKTIMNITTERDEDVIFTPYFLTDKSPSGTTLLDILINNDDKLKSYDVGFKSYTPHLTPVINPYLVTEEHDFTPYISPYEDIYSDDNSLSYYSDAYYFYPKSTDALDYKNFVYENYLSVPQNVRSEMLQLALENGFLYQGKQYIIDDVKDFVAGSARYSLQTEKVPQGEDIALWLLNDSETGYCVHFATAATLMLRSMGIPARYVSGYCVENFDETSTQTIVSSDNAHAWVEYFDDNIGWVPLDATPSSFDVPSYSAPVEDTQPQPTTVQQSTAPTITSEAPTQVVTRPVGTITAKPHISLTPISVICIIIGVLLLAVLTVILRRKSIISSRQKNFTTGSTNNRAKHMYKYLLRLTEFSHVSLPEEITDIADKARFSGRKITTDELDIIARFTKSRTKAMTEDSPIIKKIYLKYILVLI